MSSAPSDDNRTSGDSQASRLETDSAEVKKVEEAPVVSPEKAGGDATSETPAKDKQTESQSDTSGIRVRFAGVTSVGLVREHNEDNLVNANLTTGKIFPRGETCSDIICERGSIFAVCDGMGGAAAGEVASQMAVDTIFNTLRAGQQPANRDELAEKLVFAVEEAGEKIYDTAQSDTTRRGMGTTTTAAVLMDKVLFVAQVGDSRAYMLRRGEVKQLTKDQSLVDQLIEAGHFNRRPKPNRLSTLTSFYKR